MKEIIMRCYRLLLVGLVALALVGADQAVMAQDNGPIVFSVRASQRAGTNLVDVFYGVTNDELAPVNVTLHLSTDGGQTYPFLCQSVSGDVGSGVEPGVQRHIVWDAGADFPGFSNDTCKLQVTAVGGTQGGDFEFISGGVFYQGESMSGYYVLVGSYFIATAEVTQAQYAVHVPHYNVTHPNRPVVNVNWYQAIQYCNWLSIQEGLTPAYEGAGASWTWNRDANGYRLPTESEWEYACRAGSVTAYCNGDTEADLAQVGWYSGNSGGQSHNVKTKNPNQWNLYDMHGNVWEWCWDWYGGYPSGTTPENPHIDNGGPTTGTYRVARGGAFDRNAAHCRSAGRVNYNPGVSLSNGGFRLARSAF